MSDKAESKPESASAPAGSSEKGGGDKKKGGGGIFTKMPVLLGGVMILEAAVLFAGFKFLGAGANNAAAGAALATAEEGGEHGGGGGEHGDGHGGGGTSKAVKKFVEVKVVEFRAPNKLTGKTFVYDVAIYAMVRGDDAEHVKKTIEERGALIQDRIRTIIASNDPEKLGGGSEPGLETLRRQVKHQLDEVIGESMVSEVLVPRCIPFASGY